MHRSLSLVGVVGALALGAEGPETRSASSPVPVTIEFRDAAGRLIPVRAGVFAGSIPLPPEDAEAHVFQLRGPESYFYCDGSAVVNAPPGAVTIRAGRGFEYQPRDTTLVVDEPTTVTITLPRVTDMSARGFYSGDTHVHIAHAPILYTLDADDVLLVTRAEDLNLINVLEEQSYFTGANHPVSLPDRIVRFSKEQRNAHFSHLTILGLKQWIYDQGCTETGMACGRTLDAAVHAQVHAQGETAVIATHPFSTHDYHDLSPWPGGGMWRAMAIDLPAGAVDAVDLLSYTSASPFSASEPYFEALNAKFRLPPSAGTDCNLATGQSLPAGGYRVYVETNGPLTIDSWIAGLKAGRSFVTTYPLFTRFDVDGARPGDVYAKDGSTLRVSVSVVSGLPIERVEIIGNPGVLRTVVPPGGPAKSVEASFEIPRGRLTWVVARAAGRARHWHSVAAWGVFAQTAPVYIEPKRTRPGPEPETTADVQVVAATYFMQQLDELEAVYNQHGNFPGNSRAAFDAALLDARRYFSSVATVTPVIDRPMIAPAWEIRSARPNPFGHEVRVSYVVPGGGGDHSVHVYDATGRAVRRLFAGRRSGGEHEVVWDGRDERGVPAASGVYLVRISAGTAAVASRKLVLVR